MLLGWFWPSAEWQVLAGKGAKPRVGFQVDLRPDLSQLGDGDQALRIFPSGARQSPHTFAQFVLASRLHWETWLASSSANELAIASSIGP